MDREDLILAKYGVNPKKEHREEIIELLEQEIENEPKVESHECLRVLCFLLFSIGIVEDSELIWKAKMLNMDTGCMVDAVFLCGAGYKETLAYLDNRIGLEKLKKYLKESVDKNFRKDEIIDEIKEYYHLG